MQYKTQPPTLEDDLPEDDVDRLFSQLELVEAPPSCIAHILEQVKLHASTASLPLLSQPAMMLLEFDNWTVQQHKRNLC